MASARGASAARPRPERSPPQRARPRVVGGRPVRAGAIRWDRLGRSALRLVFIGVALLYVHPLLSILSTRQDAQKRHGEVVRLAGEKRELQQRITALRGDKALEREARRLGMVRRGERAYVITGLPD